MEHKSVKTHKIKSVEKGSVAEKAGLKVGDVILTINGEEIEDIFDYRYDILSSHLKIGFLRDEEPVEITVEKPEDDDLGLEFDEGLMDDYRSCRNGCIFCFIDQMPPGLRKTLYFKDDDQRLSFLQGNYVTLTNLSEHDVDRIIKFRMEPINISFQTTNPELRCKMLRNRFAGDCLKIVDRLYENGITMNGQIVLCKGYNDKDELKRSIEDLSKYIPYLESVSVVPVGLTKYREKLTKLEPFTKDDACEVIDMIEDYQKKFYEESGTHFIHASDEWYINAGRELPEEDRYDGYLQLANGVGMTRLLINEFYEALASTKYKGIKKHFMKRSECTLVTGKLVYPVMKEFADKVNKTFPKADVDVVAIRNDFFGETITVAGLLTGGDIVKQLKEHGYKKRVLLPQSVLKADEDIFLDDMTLDEFKDSLQVKVDIVKSSGRDLLDCLLDVSR